MTTTETPLDPKVRDHVEGISVDATGEEPVDQRLAAIEMAGEEVAAGWKPDPVAPLAPEVRYLHISRTIHQLVSDRNRSVGIFLFVASVLFGASTALLNAHETVATIIPIKQIQYWCFPVTFATLGTIGAFMSLILIRARIGLIYEVSKMNALLGLPSERVRRVNPLSIFFLMHAMVVLLGGCSAGFAAGMLASRRPDSVSAWGIGLAVAALYVVGFHLCYYLTVLHATTETKLAVEKTKVHGPAR
jgi:hypothetical protein